MTRYDQLIKRLSGDGVGMGDLKSAAGRCPVGSNVTISVVSNDRFLGATGVEKRALVPSTTASQRHSLANPQHLCPLRDASAGDQNLGRGYERPRRLRSLT